MTFPGYDNEDNLIGWIQEEYYDDIYGDLFQKEENGYFNNWLEKNSVNSIYRFSDIQKKKEEEIQLKILREKKSMMQSTMDQLYGPNKKKSAV